ncbi:right-handed parallel beta-helix repeat-containing protein [Aquimarina sp. 2201CG1-2-11]|uniref:right-handed parallel beta-helix repeat-containing protein n=1 Tax=Aquimarina discodermiae TaxID=3231043 RepID=UPI0034625F78
MKLINLKFVTIIYVMIMSCTKNDDFQQVQEEIDVDQPENVITTPCNFDASSITANSTVVIDCVLDLDGATVTLPENVNFEFKGGDIVNGTLVFAGGTIDGRLLSYKLEVKGEVRLSDPAFKFYAVRWDITEGSTTSDIALQNTAKLENVMFMTSALGATTFRINKLDAFFEVTRVTGSSNKVFRPSKEAVNIPSNFNLEMTENTHLRIYPGGEHNRQGGAIMAIRDESNITVTGGNFHGDRDQRTFSPDDNGLEGSHLFLIHSGKNVVIDGVNFQDGSAGTFAIFSFGFSFNPDYNPTTNVTIKNCVIRNSRRMAIALTDGRDIVIEGNTFIDAGQPSANTDGGEVGYAINIEPDRFRNDAGELMERQRVFDVLIKGNTESGSRGGFLTLTIGQDITVEGNTIGTRVVHSLVSGIKIVNNSFKAVGHAVDSWAVFSASRGETVFNNEIAGNIIEGYSLGIVSGSHDCYVHDNTIVNCKSGIQLSKATQTRIHDNTINVTDNGIQATNTNNNDVELKGNNITSGGFHALFVQMNNKGGEEDFTVTLDNNTFSGNRKVTLSNSNGIIFTNNEVLGGMEIGNTTNSVISSNVIKPNASDGIRLFETHNNITVRDNTVFKPSGSHACINNDSTTPNAVTLSNNSCN